MEGHLEDVDLSVLISRCARFVSRRYHVPDDVIKLDLVPAMVRARPMDLEMVFRNLVDNAVKYSGDAPQVRIESRWNGHGSVVTRIADNGPGIPAALRRKIFGRFVRLGSELERSKAGTGLGLYIVRTLVRRMKGKVSVRSSNPGEGTVFEVELPARSADRAEDST
jgi:signal transduction histidine kinase